MSKNSTRPVPSAPSLLPYLSGAFHRMIAVWDDPQAHLPPNATPDDVARAMKDIAVSTLISMSLYDPCLVEQLHDESRADLPLLRAA